MDLAGIKRRVRAQVRDTSAHFVDSGEVEDFINDGYLDIAARTRILQKEVTGTWTGTSLPLPPTDDPPNPDVVEVLDLKLGTDDHVSWVDFDTFWAYQEEDASLDGTIGRIFAGAIELYPVPAAGTAYTLRYTYLPAVLDSGEDVPVLPAHLHIKLAYYALWQAKMKLGELDEADRFMLAYEQALPPPIKGMVTLAVSPLSLIPEPGPFDRDPEARHF